MFSICGRKIDLLYENLLTCNHSRCFKYSLLRQVLPKNVMFCLFFFSQTNQPGKTENEEIKFEPETDTFKSFWNVKGPTMWAT